MNTQIPRDPKPIFPKEFGESLAADLRDPDEYLKKAKLLVSHHYNSFLTKAQETDPDDFYVVWFAKVLGNWKALVSTDVASGLYWEVTYNGNKNETYVDAYTKQENRVYKDDVLTFDL